RRAGAQGIRAGGGARAPRRFADAERALRRGAARRPPGGRSGAGFPAAGRWRTPARRGKSAHALTGAAGKPGCSRRDAARHWGASVLPSASRRRTMSVKKILEVGGFISGAILIAFGIAVIVLGVSGRSTVNSSLKQEQITGTPDMTPALIKAEATKAGLKNVSFPTCSVAGKAITNGTRARCFAQYMRIHALEATGGVPYALMPR